jgi:hypothetical protein
VQEVYSSDNWVYIRTTGLGIHAMGPWLNGNFPNLPVNTKTFWRFPRTNSVLATKTLTGLGAIALARELGISETSLGNWVRAYREKHAEDEPPLQLSERARLRELERENRELRMKAEFLSKAAAYFAAEHR